MGKTRNGRHRRWLVWGAVIFAAVCVGCKTPPTASGGDPGEIGALSYPEDGRAEPTALPTDRPEDLLFPGDHLLISIHGHPDLERRVGIPPVGIVHLPLIGATEAAGHTVPEIVRAIRTAYEKDFLKRADVTVSVIQFAAREVYILGAVKREGAYPIPVGKGLKLLQLLALAGGFAEGADRDDLVVRRGSGDRERVFKVSYGQLRRESREEGTFFLHPGDTVIVGHAQSVYVFGRVNRPGSFPIGEGGLSVIQAISLAGGFQRIAAPQRTIVIREAAGGKRETFRIPVSSIVDDESLRDFRLRPGDIIHVPEGLF